MKRRTWVRGLGVSVTVTGLLCYLSGLFLPVAPVGAIYLGLLIFILGFVWCFIVFGCLRIGYFWAFLVLWAVIMFLMTGGRDPISPTFLMAPVYLPLLALTCFLASRETTVRYLTVLTFVAAVFAEATGPAAPLTRTEFRRLCDEYVTKKKIIRAIEKL